MKNPAQVMLRRFAVSFVHYGAFEVFVVVREEHVARLVADLFCFLQAKLGRESAARNSLDVVEYVPARSFLIFFRKLVTTNNHLHPKPLRLADVQYESAD